MATSDFALLTVENTDGVLALKRKPAAEVVPESASPVIGAAAGDAAVLPDAAGERVLRSVKVNVEPVQEGSGDPAPDNVRPITGWTGARVSRSGKNQGFLDSTNVASTQRCTVTYDGGVVHVTSTGTYGRSGYVMNVKPGRQYTLSFEAKRGSASVTGIYVNNKIGWADQRYAIWVSAITESYSVFTVTFTADTDTLFFGIYPGMNDVADHEIYVKNFQLEFGSEATDYEPYAGDTFDVAFPTEAGTVYGGVLDLTAGTLTVNRAMVDLGTLNWKVSSTPNCYFASTQNVVYKSHDADMACSRYRYNGMRGFPPYYGDSGTITAYLTGTGTTRELYVHDDTLTNLEEYKAAMSGVQLVYELAEPVVYQLVPVQIAALAGLNNVFADCGPVEVEYVRDTGAAIEAANADTRAMIGEASGETASRSLAVGEYVAVGYRLYRVTSAVGAGETLVPGSNVTETTVGAELSRLAAMIS